MEVTSSTPIEVTPSIQQMSTEVTPSPPIRVTSPIQQVPMEVTSSTPIEVTPSIQQMSTEVTPSSTQTDHVIQSSPSLSTTTTVPVDQHDRGNITSSDNMEIPVAHDVPPEPLSRKIHDDCVFVRHVGSNFSLIAVHVDDILQVATSDLLVQELHDKLIERFQNIVYHPNPDSYLGLNIDRSSDGSEIKVNHLGKITELCSRYLRAGTKSMRHPAREDLFNIRESPALGDQAKQEYLSIVMALMYIGRLTRIDILLPTTFLASRAHVATEDDLAKLLHILCYLSGTPALGITISCTHLSIHIQCDASYGVHTDARSHTGYVIMLGGKSFLFAKSSKQKTVSTSSTEAEVHALVDAVKTGLWLQDLIHDLGLKDRSSVKIYQDNQSAIQLVSISENNAKGSKHYMVKLTFLKELSMEGKIELEYLCTDEMSADMLTKPLVGKKFMKHRQAIMGYVETDQRGMLADITNQYIYDSSLDLVLYSTEHFDLFADLLTDSQK
jgi:hypothetical protein